MIMLVVYTAMMILVAVKAGKPKGVTEFHVANRKLGIIPTAFSIAATWLMAPALFTSAEQAYLRGNIGLFWFLAPNFLCLLLFIPFAGKLLDLAPNGITLSGFMGQRYGPGAKRAYLFQLSTLSVTSTGLNLLAGGVVLHTITGLPFPILTIILAAIAYSYSQFSGIKASVITDFIQMVLVLAACFLFVPWAIQRNGLQSLVTGLSGPNGEYGNIFSKKGLELFLSFGLPTMIGLISGPFGDQNFWQRAYAIPKQNIKKVFLIGALSFITVPLSMGLLGYIARGSGFVPINPGVVNLEIVSTILPSWTMMIFILMLISGLLSTVDSNLCAIASLTTDITSSENINISRGAMVLNLVLGILVANIPGMTITNIFLIHSIMRASTFAVTVLALKGKRLRWVAQGVIASMVLGAPLFAWGTFNNSTPAKVAGSLITLCASGIIALIGGRHADKKRA
jgi:Na+/proline symporter